MWRHRIIRRRWSPQNLATSHHMPQINKSSKDSNGKVLIMIISQKTEPVVVGGGNQIKSCHHFISTISGGGRAGVVPTLMGLLTESGGGMVDEALAILAILASHAEGKLEIGAAEAVPVLVEVIGGGSPRNRENAAAVLLHLCSGDHKYMVEAQELGVMAALLDLAQNGTEWGKRKAQQLLDRISRYIEQQKQAQKAQTESQSEANLGC